jgi:diguanylate cyclase (GGDEF)-like protein/PAS domain S-box-containing protein
MAENSQKKQRALPIWKTRIVFKFMMISLPFLVLISLALFIIAPYWYEQHSLKDFQNKALAISRIASYSLAPAVVFEDQEGTKEILASLSQNQDVAYILVFDQNGKELSRFSRKEKLTLDLSEVKKNGYSSDKQLWNVYSEIRHEEKVVGHLAIGFSMAEVYGRINRIRRLIAIASILMLGLGLLLTYFLSSSTTKPLRQMTRTVRQIAAGDLSQRATVSSADEVGDLAQSFNLMVDKLKQTLDHLQEARANLEKRVEERTAELKKQMEEKEVIARKLKESEELFRNMVENLGEAVVIADENQNFLFANQAANHIFEEFETGLVGKNLKDYLSSDQQQLVSWQTARRKRGLRDVYELDITLKEGRQKTLLVNAVPQFDQQGNYVSTLAVMTDITEKKKEEAALAEAKASLEKAYAELKKNNEQSSLLVDMGDAFQLANSEEEIISLVINFSRKIFPEDSVLLYVRPGKENFLQLAGNWNFQQKAEELINLDDCWAIRKSAPYFVLNPASEVICPHLKTSSLPNRPVACLPLNSYGENLGLLVVFCCREGSGKEAGPEVESLLTSKKQLLVTFSQRVAMALSNFRLRQKLQEQSIRDPLTGLYNRRYLEETLERELLRARRAGHPVSVIMLDIDRFKKFNDTYGHEAGDFILQAVARTIQKSVRAEDIVCRYGGEEFTVILPGLELKKAVSRAELILDSVRHLEINYSGSLLKNLTISAGVAAFPEHGEKWPELLQAADAALLQAKSQGRNRVVMAKKDNPGKTEE